MSALRPLLPGDIERWARERPEPVELDMPGWQVDVAEASATFPNERSLHFTRGAARIHLRRWWDAPRNPGMPMTVASERDLVVADRAVKLVTTSAFEGQPNRVLLSFVTGQGYDVEYRVRVVLDGYEDIDEVVRNMRVRW